MNGIHEVVGSNPIVSTIFYDFANKGGTAGIILSSLVTRGFSFLSLTYLWILGQLLFLEKVVAHER